MTNNPYTPNVARGIQALDDLTTKLPNLIPQDWRDYIDKDTLNMQDGAHCILGQIGAHQDNKWSGPRRFVDMSYELNHSDVPLPTNWEVDWGFDVNYSGGGLVREAYRQLAQAWRDCLNEN